MNISRRDLIIAAAATPVAAHAAREPVLQPTAPDDEDAWARIAAQYDVTREVIQLENGNWGMMPRPVLAAYERSVERVNRDTSFYARRGMVKDLDAVRDHVAAELGFLPEEVALTRNATEALTGLIERYNRLRPGDAVLYADLDYDSMQASMAALRQRRGVEVVTIALPEPATSASLIDAYAAAFDKHPRLRLVLLTHLSHRTGLVLPVREIVAMARARGIDAIVDAAHSVWQLDFRLADLDADFIGINLHKWLGAPLGIGAMVIRRSRLHDIDPSPANETADGGDIDARIHTGTLDYAAHLTVPAALKFQASIGAPVRAARLRWLRDRWVSAVRDVPGVEVLTPDDPSLHGAITSFRLRGRTSAVDNIAIAATLLDEFGIFTVHRTGVARGACIRVTPGLFTRASDVDALAAALGRLAPRFAA